MKKLITFLRFTQIQPIKTIRWWLIAECRVCGQHNYIWEGCKPLSDTGVKLHCTNSKETNT